MRPIDVELTSGADFCVRQVQDGKYAGMFFVELGAAGEYLWMSDLEEMREQLTRLIADSEDAQ